MHSKDYGGLFIFNLLLVNVGIQIAYIGIKSTVAGSIHAMRAWCWHHMVFSTWVSFNLFGQSWSRYPSLGFILQLEVRTWVATSPWWHVSSQFTKTADRRLSPETSFLISLCVDIFVTSWRKGSEAGSGLVRSFASSEYFKGFLAAGLKPCFETTPSTLQWPVRSMRSPPLTVQVTRCSEVLVLHTSAD